MRARVVLSGGGFGGHVSMAIAIGQAFRAAGVEHIDYIGCREFIEHRMVTLETDFPFHPIRINAIPGSGSFDGERMLAASSDDDRSTPPLILRHLLWPGRLLWATLRSLVLLRRLRPDVVVATGALVSAPVVMAAIIARIPTVLHEANEAPGRVNSYLAPFASLITTGGTSVAHLLRQSKTVVSGNPVRQSFAAPIDRRSARGRLGLDPSRRTLVVTGGSLGAPPLNRAVADAAEEFISRFGMQIVLQTGEPESKTHLRYLEKHHPRLVNEPRYRVEPFMDDFNLFLGAADVVVSRAGAATLSEIDCLGIPAIIVPFARARGDHQSKNAGAAVQRGLGVMVHEEELDGERLLAEVEGLLATSQTTSVRSFAGFTAADYIAHLALAVAQRDQQAIA